MAQTKIPKGFARTTAAIHAGLFRASGGKLGARVGKATVGLLITRGRKTGKQRTTPLFVVSRGTGWVIVASASGHDQHPAWYLNLTAEPTALLRIGSTTYTVTHRDLEGEERSEAWALLTSVYADYDEYEKVTDRQIPVVALEPVS